MEILVSALIGGIFGAIVGGVFHLVIKNPEKKKKIQPIMIGLIVVCTFQIRDTFLHRKILGLMDRKYHVASIMGEGMKELMENPLVKVEIEKGGEHAKAYAFILSQQGIKHLELSDLLIWNSYKIKMAEGTLPYCAGLLTGKLDEQTILDALTILSDEEIKGLVRIMVKGATRKLNGQGDPRAHVVNIQEAMKEIIGKLNATENERITKTLNNLANAETSESCWASLTIMKGVQFLSDDKKSVMLKGLAGT